VSQDACCRDRAIVYTVRCMCIPMMRGVCVDVCSGRSNCEIHRAGAVFGVRGGGPGVMPRSGALPRQCRRGRAGWRPAPRDVPSRRSQPASAASSAPVIAAHPRCHQSLRQPGSRAHAADERTSRVVRGWRQDVLRAQVESDARTLVFDLVRQRLLRKALRERIASLRSARMMCRNFARRRAWLRPSSPSSSWRCWA